jgi:glyoxylate/hydroxypyruvate reductase A
MRPLSIVVAPGPWDPAPWRKAFQAAAEGRPVHIWPHDGSVIGEDPYVICAWKSDPKVFDHYSTPRAVFSLGAGVDHLHVLRSRPDIPIVRVIDPDLTMRMVEYVAFAVLYLHRKIPVYKAEQARRAWRPMHQPAAARVRVGIMGTGVLGEACGKLLSQLGFEVAGWARSRRDASPFPVFSGRDSLGSFLERTEILVNLLPNTPETAGLIGHEIFQRLDRHGSLGGAFFVNAGRGETVVESELTGALTNGILTGAVLDVFNVEPLPVESPLWAMDNVLVTPHVAADSDPEVIVAQILRDVKRLERGEGPLSIVDMSRGY